MAGSFFSFFHSRQKLYFVETEEAPITVGSAQYLSSGSLKYEFPRELFQTPLQLIKITNLQAQVSLQIMNEN